MGHSQMKVPLVENTRCTYGNVTNKEDRKTMTAIIIAQDQVDDLIQRIRKKKPEDMVEVGIDVGKAGEVTGLKTIRTSLSKREVEKICSGMSYSYLPQ